MQRQIITGTMATVLWYTLYFEGGFLALIIGYVVARLRAEKKRLAKLQRDVDFWE